MIVRVIITLYLYHHIKLEIVEMLWLTSQCYPFNFHQSQVLRKLNQSFIFHQLYLLSFSCIRNTSSVFLLLCPLSFVFPSDFPSRFAQVYSFISFARGRGGDHLSVKTFLLAPPSTPTPSASRISSSAPGDAPRERRKYVTRVLSGRA